MTDWKPAERPVLNVAQAAIGQFRFRLTQSDTDASIVLELTDAVWTSGDRFGALLDSPTGNAVATYESGAGLRAESVREVLFEAIQVEVELITPNADDDELYWTVTGIIEDYENRTLQEIVDEMRKKY